jgi:hypothetical protein
MQFNDSTAGQGLVQDVWFRTGTDVNQFSLANITRYINEAYSKAAYIIMKSDGRMQWDDANHSDAPISTFNLVDSQQDYEIYQAAPSAVQDWLQVEKVEILTNNDIWQAITPVDKGDFQNMSLEETYKTDGDPIMYDFNGASMYLYPAPNYAKSNAMKIWFRRSPSYFASTDTTKKPGFATIFHDYLSTYAAYQWNSIKKKDFSLKAILDQKELDMGTHYARRNKIETPKITRSVRAYR